MPVEDDDLLTEHHLSVLLASAAATAPQIPGDVLAAGAQRLGARRRNRRRAGVLVGAAALAAAACCTAGLGGSADWLPGVTPAQGSGADGKFMVRTLTSLLPAGHYRDAVGLGVRGQDAPGASLVFDDGHGASLLNLSADRVAVPLTSTTQGTRCADPFFTPTTACSRTVLDDGSVLVVDQLAPTAENPVVTWTAVRTSTDGRQIRLDEFNAPNAGPRPSRAVPPLNPEQLAAVVSSPQWDAVFDDFTRGPTAPAEPNGAGAPVPSQERILTRVHPLLPPGVSYVDGSPQETAGAAHLTVRQGRRVSTVVVTVVPAWQRGQEKDPRSVFEAGAGTSLTRTPDGADVALNIEHVRPDGTGPAISWHVDALLADGTRVMVDEWNGTSGYTNPPGSPVLTLAQLATVATASGW